MGGLAVAVLMGVKEKQQPLGGAVIGGWVLGNIGVGQACVLVAVLAVGGQ
jgi:hypothetical protein